MSASPKQQTPQPPETPLEATRQLLDISVTERGSFRSCRRRWWLEVIENLEPRGEPALALEFGTGLHSGLEVFHHPHGSLVEALEVMGGWQDDTLEKFDASGDLEEEIVNHAVLGHGMLEHYEAFDKVSPVKLGRPLAIEGQVMTTKPKLVPKVPEGYPKEAAVVRHESGRLLVPMVDPITKGPVHAEHPDGGISPLVPNLSARIDLLTERKTPKKGIWIVDHKSAAQAPNDRGIDFDDQVTGYCYVVWRWLGLIPRGVVYNVLIKNQPKPPRELKNGDLSTAKDQLTTPDLYRAALKEHGLYWPDGTITSEKHAECLEALIAKGWDPFFRRFEVTRTLAELESFERRLFQEWTDMREVYGNQERLYPNPSTFSCPRCPVAPICQSMEDGSDFEGIIEGQFRQSEDRKA